MTKEKRRKREGERKKRRERKVTKMLIYLTFVKSKTVPKVVEDCLLYVVTNTQYPRYNAFNKSVSNLF